MLGLFKSSPSAPARPQPKVSLKIDPAEWGSECTVAVTVDLPLAPDHATRAEEFGPTGLRKAVLAACEYSLPLTNLKLLRSQIACAEQRLALAESALRRVEAAKVLLEGTVEADFAAKLHAIQDEMTAAAESKATAERELATLRERLARFWRAASSEVAKAFHNDGVRYLVEKQQQRREALQQLDAARQRAEEAIAKALAEHVVPLVDEVLALYRGDTDAWSRGNSVIGEAERRVVNEVMGPVPQEVREARA